MASASVFKSKLVEELSYDNLFEDEGIHSDDREMRTYVYNINIFGSNYEIAIGNKNSLDEYNISYHFVYLIKDEKVVSKIGLYEYNNDDQHQSNFEELDLILNPRHYNDPLFLRQFSTPLSSVEEESEETEETEEGKEELPENVGRANTNGTSIVLSGNKLSINKEGEIQELYELIKTKVEDYERSNTENLSSIKQVISTDFVIIIGYMFKTNTISKTDEKQMIKLIKETTINNDTKKKTTRFTLFSKAKSYKNNMIYNYVINNLVLVLLEFILNIKFVILNDNNEMTSICPLHEYGMENIKKDYVEKTKNKINKYIKDKTQIEKKMTIIDSHISNYNPSEVIFLKRKNDSFVPLYYNGKIIHNMYDELDNDFRDLFKEKYEEQTHHYLNEHFNNMKDEQEDEEQDEETDSEEDPDQGPAEQE